MLKLRFLDHGLTPFWNAEFLSEVCSLLEKKYAAYLNDEVFVLEAGSTATQVQLRLTLAKRDGSYSYPIECVLPRSPQDDVSPDDAGIILLDYLDVYWNEFLTEGRDTWVTIDWSEHHSQGLTFYLRGFPRNLAAEQEAEALFRKHGHGDHDITTIGDEA